MVGHISNHESIPTHKHHASIFFQEFLPRDKPCVTPRASFASNYVSDQKEMKFTKVREVFVYNRPKKEKILHFLSRYHGLGSMSKIQVSQENFCNTRVTLVK